MKRLNGPVALLALLGGVSCASSDPAGTGPMPGVDGKLAPRPGLAELGAGTRPPTAFGQTIYVPAYSSVYVGNTLNPFELSITVTLRNNDPTRPIVATSVRYHDHDGQLVRDYLKAPVRLAPLASAEFFVLERDRSGKLSSSFLIDWAADGPVQPASAESVMIGVASAQGISFTFPGRVVASRGP